MPTVGSAPAQVATDQPARYEIVVSGRLGDNWSERLSGLKIASVGNEMHLTGWLTDQAALMGVLNTLYTLGLALTLVRRLPP